MLFVHVIVWIHYIHCTMSWLIAMLYEYFVKTWMPISGAPGASDNYVMLKVSTRTCIYPHTVSLCTQHYGIELWWCIHASVNWVRIASGNGLATVRGQTITWTNADFLSIGPLEIKLSEIWIKMWNIFLEKMWLKLMSAKYQLSFSSFCVCVLCIHLLSN